MEKTSGLTKTCASQGVTPQSASVFSLLFFLSVSPAKLSGGMLFKTIFLNFVISVNN
jgi:hypothetical protein